MRLAFASSILSLLYWFCIFFRGGEKVFLIVSYQGKPGSLSFPISQGFQFRIFEQPDLCLAGWRQNPKIREIAESFTIVYNPENVRVIVVEPARGYRENAGVDYLN